MVTEISAKRLVSTPSAPNGSATIVSGATTGQELERFTRIAGLRHGRRGVLPLRGAVQPGAAPKEPPGARKRKDLSPRPTPAPASS